MELPRLHCKGIMIGCVSLKTLQYSKRKWQLIAADANYDSNHLKQCDLRRAGIGLEALRFVTMLI